MAVVSIKNKLRRGNLLAGNDPYIPTAFESIATVTVGSGGAANVEFTSIPGTYTHLQIRGIGRAVKNNNVVSVYVRANSDSGSNYAWHGLYGDGSSAGAQAGSSTTFAIMPQTASDFLGSNIFGATIIDILDYANTNKYKTFRGLGGWDANGSGNIAMRSSLWMSTSAITSLTIYADSGENWKQYTTFALYGIKGA